MKKWTAVVAVAVTLAIMSSGAAQAQRKKIAMGCSQVASSQYAYCVGQAKAINTLAPDLDVTVMETGATIDNLRRMTKNQIDYGMVTPGSAYLAWKGLDLFKAAAIPDIRILWYYTVSPVFWSVREDSGVKTPAELMDKKFNPGMRGSSTEKDAETVLNALGIKAKIVRGGTTDAVDAIRDNHIIGYTKVGNGFSLDASTMDIAAQTPIRVLGFSEEQVKRVRAAAPYITWVKVPAGAIKKGMDEFWTPSLGVGFGGLKSLPDDVAYKITKAVMEGQEYQRAAFRGVADDMIKCTMEQAISPLHAGAIRYYREKGAKIPENLIPPEAK
jgi:uncharacterized protein